MAKTLSEYYSAQGQALPSVSERKSVAEKAGIQNYSGTAQQNTQLLGYLSSNGTPKITSDAIKPVTPSKLPDAQTPTYAGMQGAMEQVAIDNRTQAEKQRDALKKNTESSLDAYMKEIINSGSISSSVDRTQEDKQRQELDKYTGMLEQEQLANRRRIEQLQKNTQGALAGGVAIETERINRESLSKQADIAILQTSANRMYDTAKSIADRAVAMKLEQSNANLNALRFFYDQNKSAFDKADDRIYSELLAKKEAEAKRLERNETAISQLKLNVAQYGGGPALLAKLSAIDTTKPDAYDKALAIAGKYGSDPLDRALKSAKLANATSVSSGTLSSKTISDIEKNKNTQNAIVGIEAKNLLDQYNAKVRSYGKTPTPAQRKDANSFLVNVLAPKLSVALGQGGMTGDEAKAKIDSLGLRGIGKREKVTWQNIDSTIAGINSLINTSLSALDSSIPGASDNYSIFQSYKSGAQSGPISEEDYTENLTEKMEESVFNVFE